ncbi:MAG TPA: hydrogenase 2 operon protein HybA [Rhodospirillales bacterium]|nr:hydrogenase 2 operon protein HybA [Rhodospirillales bacterium]
MTPNRRGFLQSLAVGGAATAAAATTAVSSPSPAEALQRAPKQLPPEAVGLLYDSTLCVGCKACVSACKTANGMPVEIAPRQKSWNPGLYDSPKGLSGKTLNVILVYRDGAMEEKDRAENGFAFIKRQCLHCVDPSCVSCCPVSAMIKDPLTGIVSHDKDACIGCRYCVFACPFEVPKFELDETFGQIQKCQLCNHRLPEGKLPGCVESCPTGATLFGRVEDLRREAHRRLALQPGDTYEYPRNDLSGHIGPKAEPHAKVVEAAYIPEVYGGDSKVLGGTQALYVSAVPFDKLGLPWNNVPPHGYATLTEGVQHTLYRWMLAPAVVLGGLVYFARRNFTTHHPDDATPHPETADKK